MTDVSMGDAWGCTRAGQRSDMADGGTSSLCRSWSSGVRYKTKTVASRMIWLLWR